MTLGFRAIASLAIAAVTIAGCGGDAGTVASSSSSGAGAGGPILPPRVCKTPKPHEGPWFVEVTKDVGLAKTDALEPIGTSVVAGDLDGDGYVDFFTAFFMATREKPGDERTRFLFMNRPDPKDPSHRVFVDASDESGLFATRDGSPGRRGITIASLADLDNDGDLDVIGCPGSGDIDATVAPVDPCVAFLNDGKGHFTMAPEGELDQKVFWVPSSVTLDYDLDGIIDFWPGTVGRWYYGPAKTSAPRLYRGLGDGTFTNVASEVGLPAAASSGNDGRIDFGVTSCDVDGDGHRDVLLAAYGGGVMPNYLYHFEDGKFVDRAADAHIDKTQTQGGFTFSITCGDLDDDGAADLMTSCDHHAWYPALDWSQVMMNTAPPGTFGVFKLATRSSIGILRKHIGMKWTEGDNLPVFADIDLDGRKDIFLASSNYPQQSATDPDWTHAWLWHQKDDGHFEDVTPMTPWGDKDQQSGEGPALIDVDNDGDLDLVIGTGTYNSQFLGLTNAIHVYENKVGQDSNFTRIRLEGKGAGHANRSGIGARVHVTAGGRTQHQEVLGSFGHSNTQADVTLTFGLGDACDIDEIVVDWPNQAHTTEKFEHVLANYPIVIHEDEPDVEYVTSK